jgi:K+ potassium transporter integral membrane domain
MALTALLDGARLHSRTVKWTLVALGIVGASLFYGDGVITPAISVLSAVEGLKVAPPSLGSLVLPVAVAVLTLLFAIQRYGTTRRRPVRPVMGRRGFHRARLGGAGGDGSRGALCGHGAFRPFADPAGVVREPWGHPVRDREHVARLGGTFESRTSGVAVVLRRAAGTLIGNRRRAFGPERIRSRRSCPRSRTMDRRTGSMSVDGWDRRSLRGGLTPQFHRPCSP